MPPAPHSSVSVTHDTHKALGDDRRAFGYIRAAGWANPESYVVDQYHLCEMTQVRFEEVPRLSEVSALSSTPTTRIGDTHPALVQPKAVPESVLEWIG